MKKVIIVLSLVTGVTMNLTAQTAGGHTSAGSAGQPFRPAVTPNQTSSGVQNQPTTGVMAGTNGSTALNQDTNNLTPTGNTSGTNQLNSTQDQAVTQSDQALLVTIRQGVQTQLGSVVSALPVRFFINNGIVTV